MKLKNLRRILIVLLVVLAALHTYHSRYKMGPDGISYLDIADAFGRGDWSLAISSYWGPMFPWLLGAVLAATRVQGLGQFAAAHYLNLVFFFLNVLAFDWLWSEVLVGARDDLELSRFRAFALCTGYLAFGYAFIPMLEIITPDLLLSAVVLVIGLLLWRLTLDGNGRLLVAVGALFGLGYLVKAVMFPVGVVTLVAVGVTALIQRRGLRRVVLTMAVFLLVSSPLVLILSKRAGRFSTGDTGRLAYALYVSSPSRLPDRLTFWPGQVIHSEPRIYQVEVRSRVTFWPWFNPPAVAGNVQANVNVKNQFDVLKRTLRAYRNEFIFTNAFLLMAVLLLFVTNWEQVRTIRWETYLPLATFVFSALGAFALILVEARYIVGFEFVMWAALLGIAARNLDGNGSRAAAHTWMVASFLLALQVLPSFADYAVHAGAAPSSAPATTNIDGSQDDVKVAEFLARNGLTPGDSVAIFGSPFRNDWVKLSRASISAYIPSTDMKSFCEMGEAPQQESIAAVESTGARWIVTELNPIGCPPDWWGTMPGTAFRYRRLP